MSVETEKTTVSLVRNYREAPLRPASVNIDDRTVEVVWATTAPVLRAWPDGELYYEVLSLDPAHIALERFQKGLSVLDAHNRESTKSIYGVAEDPTFPEGHTESVCRARFSKRNPEADRVFGDIQDGIIRHWSFGYDVLRMIRTDREEEGLPVYLATLWEPFELSVVPVPADPNAGVRNKTAKSRKCEIINHRGTDMTDEEKKRQEEEEKKKRQEEEEKKRQEEEEKKRLEEEEEKGKKGKQRETDDEERSKLRLEAERAKVAERRRINEIRSAHQAMPTVMQDSDVETFIASDASADDFRKALIDAAREKQPAIKTTDDFSVGMDACDKKRELMVHAILHRANPDKYPLKGEKYSEAREFMGTSLLDMARDSLERAGCSWRGKSSHVVAQLALGHRVRGMHVSADFPILLADTVNKSLRDAFELAPPTYQSFCRRASVKDFKDRNLIQIGDVSKFQKVLEGGEYKRGTFGEAKESYRVFKYGEIVPISWEMIINDDLDALSRIPASMAEEAIQLASDIVYDILLSNPKMQTDGKALFHADHGNLGTAADIDLDGMSAAFTAIGSQKNSNGRILNLRPEYLITGLNKQVKALQYLNDTVVPGRAEDVTPAQMRTLSPIVEGRITGDQWFLACRPGRIDTIEYAYLEGEEGVFTEERWGYEVDGMEIKVRMVFGAKAIDWRGLYKNPGN